MRSSVPCSSWIDSFSLLDIQVVSLRRVLRFTWVSSALRSEITRRGTPRRRWLSGAFGTTRQWKSASRASIASSYHDQCTRARNIFLLRCGTKDHVLLVPQSRQRINSGRSPCRRIASENRGAEEDDAGQRQGSRIIGLGVEQKRFDQPGRSEERRVGKECRSRWSP